MIKISVIIPVFNAVKTIGRCVKSVLSQDFDDIEILLIDDGSTDDSLTICDDLARTDNRIKVFSFENHGAAYCRNFGIKNATGEYITFIDSDDYIDSGAFSYMYKAAIDNNADIVMCGYIIENGKTSKVVSAKSGFYKGNEINSRIVEIKSNNLIDSPCNKLYRREFLVSGDIYMPEGEIYEDTDFNLRLLTISPRYLICDDAFYHYVLHMGSTTRRFNPEKLEIIKRRAELLKEVTTGVDGYCDFYYIKSVFSAFMDAFLSFGSRKVLDIIKTEVKSDNFRLRAKNASAGGISSKLIVFFARTKSPVLILFFSKAAYILKYKFQSLFMKVK